MALMRLASQAGMWPGGGWRHTFAKCLAAFSSRNFRVPPAASMTTRPSASALFSADAKDTRACMLAIPEPAAVASLRQKALACTTC